MGAIPGCLIGATGSIVSRTAIAAKLAAVRRRRPTERRHNRPDRASRDNGARESAALSRIVDLFESAQTSTTGRYLRGVYARWFDFDADFRLTRLLLLLAPSSCARLRCQALICNKGKDGQTMDLAFLLLTGVLAAATLALVFALERLRGPK
jgi:hypothetical protein